MLSLDHCYLSLHWYSLCLMNQNCWFLKCFIWSYICQHLLTFIWLKTLFPSTPVDFLSCLTFHFSVVSWIQLISDCRWQEDDLYPEPGLQKQIKTVILTHKMLFADCKLPEQAVRAEIRVSFLSFATSALGWLFHAHLKIKKKNIKNTCDY